MPLRRTVGRPIQHGMKEYEIGFGGTCPRWLGDLYDRFRVHAPTTHDAAFASVTQPTRCTGALIPALCIPVQPSHVKVGAEVCDEHLGACRRVGLVSPVGIAKGLTFAAVAFPQSTEPDASLITARLFMFGVVAGMLAVDRQCVRDDA